MKMYLKSQYHMDPPQDRAPGGALRQLYLRVYPRAVDATTGATSLLNRYRDVLIPARPGRRRLWGAPCRPQRSPQCLPDRPDDRQQRHAVFGDDGQQRMLLTGHQRDERADRAPHLLALPGRHRWPPPSRRPIAPRGRSCPGWSEPAAAVRDLGRDVAGQRLRCGCTPTHAATPPDSVENALSARCLAAVRPSRCTAAGRTPAEPGAAYRRRR